jgi:hypothetical protein
MSPLNKVNKIKAISKGNKEKGIKRTALRGKYLKGHS